MHCLLINGLQHLVQLRAACAGGHQSSLHLVFLAVTLDRCAIRIYVLLSTFYLLIQGLVYELNIYRYGTSAGRLKTGKMLSLFITKWKCRELYI